MIRLVLLADFSETYPTELLHGILTYSKGREPWVVSRMPASFRVENGLKGVVEWAKLWKADAIIGQFDVSDDVGMFAQNGVVAVALDFIKRFENVPNITADYVYQGRQAADFLIGKGFRNFAFYGYKSAVWSSERMQGFIDQLISHGHRPPHLLAQNMETNIWCLDIDTVVEWLSSLPKPIAIFACDDTHANVVLEACRLLKLKVPSEIAVLGVDNDEITCNLTDPQLSSISLDIRGAGYNTARYIDSVLHGEKSSGNDIIVDFLDIVERQSTNILMTENRHILKILSFLHQHYAENLPVSRLIEMVPMSRRLLENTFKEETGTTIHQYIMEIRFERMKQMLVSTDIPVADLAIATGLSDVKNVARIFRKRVGVTPLEHRQHHGIRHK